MIRAAIVIPTYRERLNSLESLSLRRCLEILRHYDIHFVLPEGLVPDYIPQADGVYVDRFHPDFFRSLDAYNRLMLQSDFYRRFSGYSHILVHQLDAYVFRDELDVWCGKNFDYVGAPWFEDGRLKAVAGNGGFSLRKVESFLAVLGIGCGRRVFTFNEKLALRRSSPVSPADFIVATVGFLRFKNTLGGFLAWPYMNEDWFYSAHAPRLAPGFKVADPASSMAFSFEARPSELYRRNGNRLPFGCHAFHKQEPEFWREFIPFGKADEVNV